MTFSVIVSIKNELILMLDLWIRKVFRMVEILQERLNSEILEIQIKLR